MRFKTIVWAFAFMFVAVIVCATVLVIFEAVDERPPQRYPPPDPHPTTVPPPERQYREGSGFSGGSEARVPAPSPPTTGESAITGDSSQAKEVWLMDKAHGIPFCRVTVPGDWRVEGNVAWNPNMPLAPYTYWLRLSNRRLGVVVENMVNIGEFTWQDMLERLTGLRDGTYLTDTGMFMLKYRNAGAALNDFVSPLVARMNPEAKILGIRSEPDLGWAVQAEAQKILQNGTARWHESEGSAASMMVRDGERETVFYATTIGALRRMPMNNYYWWRWPSLTAITTNGTAVFTIGDAGALLAGVSINPQWQRAADNITAQLQNRGAAQITAIHEQTRVAIQRSSEVAEKWAGKWSDHILDQSNYADPSGTVFKGPSTTNFGYVNGFGDAVIFSEREIGAANLHGYNQILRID